MSKITRVFQKLFGRTASAGELGQFGSFAAGSPLTTTDPEVMQALGNFDAGWFSAILGNNSPAIEDMNALFYLTFRQIAYIFQSGVSEWDAETEYHKGSYVAVGGVLYASVADTNTNNAVTLNTHWKRVVQVEEQNKIISSKTRSTSSQPQFLEPDGAAASFTLRGLTTPLVLAINSETVSMVTDIVKSGLTVAPSSNNTCAVNDADAASQESTRIWGELDAEKEYILIDTIGTEISGLVGKWACFKIGTEYFIAFVEADRLTNIKRGYFTDSSGNPLNRVKFSDGATITLMSTAWVFADSDGVTIDITYNNPIWSAAEPSSPAVGDYWFDTINKTWKEDDTGYTVANKTLVGIALIDTVNCVAARSMEWHKNFSDENTIDTEIESNSVLRFKEPFSRINVNGELLTSGISLQQFDMTSDLASSVDMYSATEQASTVYYFYLNEKREVFISDISPYYRPEMRGSYHPHNTWRCVVVAWNDASSNLIIANSDDYNNQTEDRIIYLKDKKSSGVGGGTSVTNTIHQRDLNSIEGDSKITILSSDAFLLLLGDHSIDAECPAWQGDRHQSYIYDGTNYIADGTPAFARSSEETSSKASVNALVKVVTPTIYSIRHWVQNGAATFGLGNYADGDPGGWSSNNPQSNEVYTTVKIIRKTKKR